MQIISDKISIDELKKIASKAFDFCIKAVVDVEKGIMSIGGELHADEEAQLLEKGSKQQDLWGINLYPAMEGDSWIEFDSLINIRPIMGNRTRGVDSQEVREAIITIVNNLVDR